MGFIGEVLHQKFRHVANGCIVDATLERANQAMVKLGDFGPLVNDQMVSLVGQGMVRAKAPATVQYSLLPRAGS